MRDKIAARIEKGMFYPPISGLTFSGPIKAYRVLDTLEEFDEVVLAEIMWRFGGKPKPQVKMRIGG